jgi:Ca2+/H+ antiporter
VNSLDAIIATTFLLVGFGIILGAINNQEELVERTGTMINSKGQALYCVAIFDSMFSNKGTYDLEANCFIENGKIVFENNLVKKEVSVLEGEVSEHYLQWSNIFD